MSKKLRSLGLNAEQEQLQCRLGQSHEQVQSIHGSPIGSISNGQQFVAVSTVSNNDMNVNKLLSSGVRMLNNDSRDAEVSTQQSETYDNVQYITVQNDHGKFEENLVPINAVEFNINGLKDSNGNPLEFYFDVLNAAPNANQTSIVTRPDHQTSKAQLYVRAYPTFIQTQDENTVKQSEILVARKEISGDNHETNGLLSQNFDSNLISFDSEYGNDFRNYPHHSEKGVQDNNSQISIHKGNVSEHNKNVIQTTVEQLSCCPNPSFAENEAELEKFSFYQKQFKFKKQEHQSPYIIRTSMESNNLHSSNNNEVLVKEKSSNLPSLVTRSEKDSRSSAEYVKLVNECTNAFTKTIIKEEKIINFDNEDNSILEQSYDEDQEQPADFISEIKKSLPHKKRIPKKLKSSRKNVRNYKCNECDEQFSLLADFNEHQNKHIVNNFENKFQCEICHQKFLLQLEFFEHLKQHYESEKYKCKECNYEFGSELLLEEHIAIAHTFDNVECHLCNRKFRKVSMLETHLRLSHSVDPEKSLKPYKCSLCELRFPSQTSMNFHLETQHLEKAQYSCQSCHKSFSSKPKLTEHCANTHGDDCKKFLGKKAKSTKAKGFYACTHCSRTFIHKNSLVYHLRAHTGERPYQCDQCGKSFFAGSALKVHLRVHSGEKPYECQHCGKFFRQYGDLRYHTSSAHSDERQFQCEFCGKDFKRKYCLNIHRRIHTGEKRFKCEYCEKGFRTSSYLQNHIRVHTGERPYPCPECGKPFRIKSDMKRHINTHKRQEMIAANPHKNRSYHSEVIIDHGVSSVTVDSDPVVLHGNYNNSDQISHQVEYVQDSNSIELNQSSASVEVNQGSDPLEINLKFNPIYKNHSTTIPVSNTNSVKNNFNFHSEFPQSNEPISTMKNFKQKTNSVNRYMQETDSEYALPEKLVKTFVPTFIQENERDIHSNSTVITTSQQLFSSNIGEIVAANGTPIGQNEPIKIFVPNLETPYNLSRNLKKPKYRYEIQSDSTSNVSEKYKTSSVAIYEEHQTASIIDPNITNNSASRMVIENENYSQ